MRTKLKASVAACVLAGATVTALSVAPAAAYAATPGSSCNIQIAVPFGAVQYPGTVSADGTTCVPNTAIPFAPSLNAGLACGTFVNVANVAAFADCPA
jgi:hypothetical protein